MLIHPTRIYKKKISEVSNIDIEISYNTPLHPHIISPIETSSDTEFTYLHYAVSNNGMTLREFTQQAGIRKTILHRIHPIDIMLQLIDAYAFMIKNNMLEGQSNINPDCIWIEREGGGIKAYVMDVLETQIPDKYRIIDDTVFQYWSTDYIHEYQNIHYYNIDRTKIPKLTRSDTRLSSNHIVNSLGLLLYFIVDRRDPYPDGRVNPNERPFFRTNFNLKYKKYIILATDPNTINRPSLNEWKFIIQKSDNYKCTIL